MRQFVGIKEIVREHAEHERTNSSANQDEPTDHCFLAREILVALHNRDHVARCRNNPEE